MGNCIKPPDVKVKNDSKCCIKIKSNCCNSNIDEHNNNYEPKLCDCPRCRPNFYEPSQSTQTVRFHS